MEAYQNQPNAKVEIKWFSMWKTLSKSISNRNAARTGSVSVWNTRKGIEEVDKKNTRVMDRIM